MIYPRQATEARTRLGALVPRPEVVRVRAPQGRGRCPTVVSTAQRDGAVFGFVGRTSSTQRTTQATQVGRAAGRVGRPALPSGLWMPGCTLLGSTGSRRQCRRERRSVIRRTATGVARWMRRLSNLLEILLNVKDGVL